MEKFQPTVVIGVGGTGKNILLTLKKMIIENSPRGMQDYPLLKLLSLDTDVSIDSVTSEIKTIKDEIKLDPNSEIETLGADGLTSTLNLEDFPEIQEWFPESKRTQLNPTMLSSGASQMKPVGRFAFAWNASKLRNKLFNLLSTTIDVNQAHLNKISENKLVPFTNVFICGSICGGTGSGTFLDVAHLVRFVAKQANVTVKIYGLMALASVYNNISGNLKLNQNCYASLVELDHFQNENNFMSKRRRFYPSYRNIGPKDWDYSISAETWAFDYPYFFDNTNEKGLSFSSPKQFAEMAARFIYLLTGSDVATKWESVSNNIWANLSEEKKHKPVRNASSGTTSIIYPRRKITQLCSYKLATEYFKYILDDSYGSVEIERLVERFLDDTKTNPNGEENSSLANLFSNFKDFDTGDNNLFEEYVSNEKDSKFIECVELIKEDKKSIISNITNWAEDMNKQFNSFKTQASVCPRDFKEKFLHDIHQQMVDLLNLKLVVDSANPLQEGQRMVRGSIIRTKKFLEVLYEKYNNAQEIFRNVEERAREQIIDTGDVIDSKLSDLKASINAVFPSSRNIQQNIEEVMNAYGELLTYKKNEYVAKLIRQFFSEILENGIHLSDGILKSLESRILSLSSTIAKFKNLQEECNSFLYKNQTENFGGFNIEIFNYKKDVEDIYDSLIKDKDFGIDKLFESLSKALQEDKNFGDDYQKLGELLPENRIIKILLTETEKYFFAPVEKVNIRERLLEDKEKLDQLISGTYLTSAKVYTRLDGQEMSASGLSNEGKVFYAISIPNEPEYDKYCKDQLSTQVGKPFVCPFDANGSHEHADQICPIYGKCLKDWILKSATADLEVIPSEDNGEINILKVVVGFPLRAITSVSGPYRQDYIKEMRKQKEDNDYNGKNEEILHMFGPVKFADLDEPEAKTVEIREEFKKDLLMTYIANRMVLDSFGCSFFTQYDIDNERENPSLIIGKNFDEATYIAESTRLNDIKAVEEIKYVASELRKSLTNPDNMEMCKTRMKEKYSIIKELPFGMTEKDIQLFRQMSIELCGEDCAPQTKEKGLWK